MRDALPELAAAGVAVIGISPDPIPQQKIFAERHGLGFPLLSDSDTRIAEAYGVWEARKMKAKTIRSIVRSAFLVDTKGRIAATAYKISPKDTVPSLRRWLA